MWALFPFGHIFLQICGFSCRLAPHLPTQDKRFLSASHLWPRSHPSPDMCLPSYHWAQLVWGKIWTHRLVWTSSITKKPFIKLFYPSYLGLLHYLNLINIKTKNHLCTESIMSPYGNSRFILQHNTIKSLLFAKGKALNEGYGVEKSNCNEDTGSQEVKDPNMLPHS